MKTEVVIAPPALYLLLAREHLKPGLEVAAQNVFDKPNGAFTGEISVDQLKDSNIGWTLLGHSERRANGNETDAGVSRKVRSALEHGLTPIVAVGAYTPPTVTASASGLSRAPLQVLHVVADMNFSISSLT